MKEQIAEIIDNCVLAYAQDTTGAAIGGVDRAAEEILELVRSAPASDGGEVRDRQDECGPASHTPRVAPGHHWHRLGGVETLRTDGACDICDAGHGEICPGCGRRTASLICGECDGARTAGGPIWGGKAWSLIRRTLDKAMDATGGYEEVSAKLDYLARRCAEDVAALRSAPTISQPVHQPTRWNVEGDEGRLRVCFGHHERSQECEWVEFVPTAPTGEAEVGALAEKYISQLSWTPDATDQERTLVTGNLRGFATWLDAAHVQFQGMRVWPCCGVPLHMDHPPSCPCRDRSAPTGERPTTCPCGGGPGHGKTWCDDYRSAPTGEGAGEDRSAQEIWLNARCNVCDRNFHGCSPDSRCGDRQDCAIRGLQRIRALHAAPVPAREGDSDLLDMIQTSVDELLEEAQVDDHISLARGIEALSLEIRTARLRGEGGGDA